jgi:hypothetical protein
MSLAVLGAVLLVVLVTMVVFGIGGAKSQALVAVLLGVVVVKSAGPMSGFANTAVSALRSAGGAIIGLF